MNEHRNIPPGNQSGYITGMFRDRESAERAYAALAERGYSKDDVNLMMSDEARKRHFEAQRAAQANAAGSVGTATGAAKVETELGNKALEGAGVGSAIGGTLGALGAAVAAVGTSLAVPGLGLVVAGPIAAALAGAGAGGLTGGLIGGLVGAGIPEERAKYYESGLKEGNIVMGVKPKNPDDAQYLESRWKDVGGQHIYR